MLKKLFLLTLILSLLFVLSGCNTQYGSVNMEVKDVETLEAVDNVLVSAEKNDVEYLTNESGILNIKELPVGDYELTITKAGYKEYKKIIAVVEGDNFVEILIPKEENTADNRINHSGTIDRYNGKKVNGLWLYYADEHEFEMFVTENENEHIISEHYKFHGGRTGHGTYDGVQAMTLDIEMEEVNSGATEYFLVYADKDNFISGIVNKNIFAEGREIYYRELPGFIKEHAEESKHLYRGKTDYMNYD